jgi:SRSO17 transposase
MGSMAGIKGVTAEIIRDYLGHADVRTTQKYIHLDVLAQKQIFEKCPVTNIADRHQCIQGLANHLIISTGYE